MTTELWLLLASVPLYLCYIGAQSIAYRAQHGVAYANSARDEERPDGVMLGRAERALRNFQETWPIFIVLALVAHLAAPGEGLFLWAALVWFAARLVYLPLYLGGVYMVRSAVWAVGLCALAVMAWAVVF